MTAKLFWLPPIVSSFAVTVMGAVVFRKLDFMGRMRVSAMRHSKDGLELVRFRNVTLGFETFTLHAESESLMRTVRSHRFDCDGRVCGHGTHLLALVEEKEPEARRHSSCGDGDFNKAVTEVHEKAIVRAAFDFHTVRCLPIKKMSMAVAFAAKVLHYMVEAESHQSSAREPREPAA